MTKNAVASASSILPSSDGKRWSAYPAGDKPAGGGGGGSYSTTFPSSQSALGSPFTIGSQQAGLTGSGLIVVGGSPNGYCYGQDATSTDWAACLPGVASTTKHYVELTMRRVAGYTAPSTHEVEGHVGLTLTSSSVVSYEFNWWFSGTLQPVRWEDPKGAYNTGVFTTISGSWPGDPAAEGDVLRIEFDSSSGSPVFTVKLNGVTKWVLTDTSAGKIVSGSPGFALFAAAGADMTKYCIKGFAAGSLP